MGWTKWFQAEWVQIDNYINFKVKIFFLEFHFKKFQFRAQSGNYTCMATNFLTVYGHSGSQQRMGTGTTIVDVKRKPGQAQIVSARQNVDVGETIKLMCQAEDAGNPSASYTVSLA